ncbi:hypothetical protein ABKV19_011016 [Rosa sericea]
MICGSLSLSFFFFFFFFIVRVICGSSSSSPQDQELISYLTIQGLEAVSRRSTSGLVHHQSRFLCDLFQLELASGSSQLIQRVLVLDHLFKYLSNNQSVAPIPNITSMNLLNYGGRFKYQPNQVRAFGMLAGGTGITPMFQIWSITLVPLQGLAPRN